MKAPRRGARGGAAGLGCPEREDVASTQILSEYRNEMENARIVAGAQIWASIQRHAGDPAWEYRWEQNGEVRT